MLSIARLTRDGIAHLAGAHFACQLLQWVTFLLLARLLRPHEFGTVAAALVFLDLGVIVADLGLGAALIQSKQLDEDLTHTAFWFNLGLGGLLALGLAVMAAPLAALFGNPDLLGLLLLLPVAVWVASMGVVPQALIERELNFQPVAGMLLAAQAGYALTTLSLAFWGGGARSVVAGMLAWHAVRVAMLFRLTPWRPRFRFSPKALRDIGPFGLQVFGAGLVGYLRKSLDVALIGTLLGPVALGIYALAQRLITWPVLRMSTVVTKVAFPTFARLQDDEERLRSGYLKLVRCLAWVTFPLLAGLAATAPRIIPLLFGPPWQAAVLPTQILCVIGMFKAIGTTDGTILFSKRRADLELKLNLVRAFSLSVTVWLAAPWGLVGVVTAMTLVALVSFPLQRWVICRAIGLSPARFWLALSPAIAVAVLAFGIGYAVAS